MGNIENLEKTKEKIFGLIEESIKRKSTYGREKNDLMKEILLGIVTGLMLPASLLMPNLPIALNPLIKNLSNQYKTRNEKFIKSIRALKRSEYIETKKHKIEISKKGEIMLIKEAINNLEIPKQKLWDKKWRIVIFDIPNSHNLARNALRETICNIGLYQLQKSVYIYPFSFKEEIDSIASLFGVYEYVIYLEVINIEGEKFLTQHFGNLIK